MFKWGGCTKYTTHHLALSGVCQEWCYASGLDYELCAGGANRLKWESLVAVGLRLDLRLPTNLWEGVAAVCKGLRLLGAVDCGWVCP